MQVQCRLQRFRCKQINRIPFTGKLKLSFKLTNSYPCQIFTIKTNVTLSASRDNDDVYRQKRERKCSQNFAKLACKIILILTQNSRVRVLYFRILTI